MSAQPLTSYSDLRDSRLADYCSLAIVSCLLFAACCLLFARSLFKEQL
jgi:hypothetical protein